MAAAILFVLFLTRVYGAPGPSGPSTDPEMFFYILTELNLTMNTENAYSVGYMEFMPLISTDCPPQMWGEEPVQCQPFGFIVSWYGFPVSMYLLNGHDQSVLVWGYGCPYVERQNEYF